MTAEEAVQRLADILGGSPTLDLPEGCQALESRGAPHALAVRTYLFMQLAWARAFLDGMGITFSPDYLLIDKDGNVVETGKLAEEPSYLVARSLADRYRSSPAFKNIVFTAADFKAVNSALMSGSKPENLVIAPAVIALESLTPEGALRMKDILQKYGETPQSDPAPKKPWWRIW